MNPDPNPDPGHEDFFKTLVEGPGIARGKKYIKKNLWRKKILLLFAYPGGIPLSINKNIQPTRSNCLADHPERAYIRTSCFITWIYRKRIFELFFFLFSLNLYATTWKTIQRQGHFSFSAVQLEFWEQNIYWLIFCSWIISWSVIRLFLWIRIQGAKMLQI